jgi:hypothetical protein
VAFVPFPIKGHFWPFIEVLRKIPRCVTWKMQNLEKDGSRGYLGSGKHRKQKKTKAAKVVRNQVRREFTFVFFVDSCVGGRSFCQAVPSALLRTSLTNTRSGVYSPDVIGRGWWDPRRQNSGNQSYESSPLFRRGWAASGSNRVVRSGKSPGLAGAAL